ncbi:TPA: hypothetical protein ACJJ8R_002108, partial [Neisseria meningitidis]
MRACQINPVFKRAAMRYAQSLEAQSIYYFQPKRTPPGLIRVAVENHLPLDLFKIYGIICLSWHHL